MKPSGLIGKFVVPYLISTVWKFITTPKPEKIFTPLKTPKKVNIQKYMGSWYVIASIPYPLEKDAHNAIEHYSWNDKSQEVEMDLTFNKDHFDGEKVQITQQAFIRNRRTNAEWRIKTEKSSTYPYVIMDLAHDYSYAVVGLPKREHVWILARETYMEDGLYNTLKGRIKSEGFNVELLQKVPQTIYH